MNDLLNHSDNDELSPVYEEAKALGVSYRDDDGNLHPENLVKAWVTKRQKKLDRLAREETVNAPKANTETPTKRGNPIKVESNDVPELGVDVDTATKGITDPKLKEQVKRGILAANQRLNAMRKSVDFGLADVKSPVDYNTRLAERYLDGTRYPAMYTGKILPTGAREKGNVYPYFGDPDEVQRDIARGCIPVTDEGVQVTGNGGMLLYFRPRVLQRAEKRAASLESQERVKDLVSDQAEKEALSAFGDRNVKRSTGDLGENLS